VTETVDAFELPLSDAVIVALVTLAGVPATAEKVAFVAPAGTVTDEGTVMADDELESATVVPPVLAAPLSVTVPVALAPLARLVGLTVSIETCKGLTVSDAVLVTLPNAAVIVTGLAALTLFVVTVKVAVVIPEGTVTDAGTVAAAVLLLARLTVNPPAGARLETVTVPFEVIPPKTVDGRSVTPDSDDAETVTAADLVDPL
jgi:hypothetical protein